ncbi:MAG: 16S rRNA (adenine1518-N6/adenine1519-N6)-dimethyltransferase [Candidatus Paceibacteria bacterium]|jgi:16S rRNA (adenine1518-N6/adenine1519-N6)-dimethyltransferase
MRAKKSLGQNFLKSGQALKAIVDAGHIKSDDLVLEVGPGKGALTSKLLEVSGEVLAVETDEDLIPILEEKFSNIKNFKLLHQDILDFDESTLGKYKLIANIPYYITGEILRKFLGSSNQPETIVLLLQKEVVDRIMARDGKESILSISIKAYGTPKYIKKVPAKAFSPAPKIDSAILSISKISKDTFVEVSEEQFFKVVKTGFAHKRKQLINNLETLSSKEDLLKVLKKLKIEPLVRAEKLSVDQWVSLAKHLDNN